MRILIAVAPIMYREALGHTLRRARPNDDVRLADPDSLDREASSFRPHLIVCSDNASEVREEVSVLSWVVIRYHDSLSATLARRSGAPKASVPHLSPSHSLRRRQQVIPEAARA